MKNRKTFKLKSSSNTTISITNPIIGITGTGKQTYLWMGNDSEWNKACYATFSGQKTLKAFAESILESLDK